MVSQTRKEKLRPGSWQLRAGSCRQRKNDTRLRNHRGLSNQQRKAPARQLAAWPAPAGTCLQLFVFLASTLVPPTPQPKPRAVFPQGRCKRFEKADRLYQPSFERLGKQSLLYQPSFERRSKTVIVIAVQERRNSSFQTAARPGFAPCQYESIPGSRWTAAWSQTPVGPPGSLVGKRNNEISGPRPTGHPKACSAQRRMPRAA